MSNVKNQEIFLGKILPIAGTIDYKKDSIVSKTLINKTTGTITLFAFDKGQGLSEHIAPFDALVYVFDGEAIITIEKKRFQLKKGELIILGAGKTHSVKAKEKFKMMLVMIRG